MSYTLRRKLSGLDVEAYGIEAKIQEVKIRIASDELEIGALELGMKKLDLRRMRLMGQIQALELEAMRGKPGKCCSERK